jgi:hypothetical protein
MNRKYQERLEDEEEMGALTQKVLNDWQDEASNIIAYNKKLDSDLINYRDGIITKARNDGLITDIEMVDLIKAEDINYIKARTTDAPDRGGFSREHRNRERVVKELKVRLDILHTQKTTGNVDISIFDIQLRINNKTLLESSNKIHSNHLKEISVLPTKKDNSLKHNSAKYQVKEKIRQDRDKYHRDQERIDMNSIW